MHGINDNENCLIENIFVDRFRSSQIQTFLQSSGSFFISPETFLQNLFIIHRKMGIAGIELAFHAEHTGFHEYGNLIRQ